MDDDNVDVNNDNVDDDENKEHDGNMKKKALTLHKYRKRSFKLKRQKTKNQHCDS